VNAGARSPHKKNERSDNDRDENMLSEQDIIPKDLFPGIQKEMKMVDENNNNMNL
jgi:hypothetical protein